MAEKQEGGATAKEEILSSDTLIENLGKDYAAYMDLDYTKEKEKFEENIDELLTRLDEYVGLIDIIRSDTTLCMTRTLPTILEKSEEMEAIFKKVDKLEAYVAMVKSNVDKVEADLDQAEADFGTTSTVKKFLNAIPVPSFFSSKKSPKAQSPAKTKYSAPPLFQTKDYVMPLEQNQAQATSGKSDSSSSQPITDNTQIVDDQSNLKGEDRINKSETQSVQDTKNLDNETKSIAQAQTPETVKAAGNDEGDAEKDNGVQDDSDKT